MGRIELGLVDRLPELPHGVLIERSERRLLVRVVEEQEPPVLLVTSAGRPHRGIQDFGLDVVRDGVGLHPSHGAGRIQGFVEIHDWADYAPPSDNVGKWR